MLFLRCWCAYKNTKWLIKMKSLWFKSYTHHFFFSSLLLNTHTHTHIQRRDIRSVCVFIFAVVVAAAVAVVIIHCIRSFFFCSQHDFYCTYSLYDEGKKHTDSRCILSPTWIYCLCVCIVMESFQHPSFTFAVCENRFQTHPVYNGGYKQQQPIARAIPEYKAAEPMARTTTTATAAKKIGLSYGLRFFFRKYY